MDNLTQLKQLKLADLAFAAQAFVNEQAHLDTVPEFERKTWTIQQEEALAWAKDNNAPTPVVDIIAHYRKQHREVLLPKTVKKSKAFIALSAAIAGQRQYIEEQILAASSVEMLESIQFEFVIPTGDMFND